MELQFYGANCIKISAKKATVVVDDNLESLGQKSVTKADHISLRTSQIIPKHEVRFEADLPGEYEIAGVVIRGIAARAHMDAEDKQSAVIYTIEADDVRAAVLGHIYPELNEDQLEKIGQVDVLFVPVGNSGYTMDGIGALKVIKQIEPNVVVPTHYAEKGFKYEVDQTELSEALKSLGMEVSETLDKYKPKTGEISDNTLLVVLNKQ